MATHLLEELVATGGRDVETQSLLGSAYKDLCEYSTSEESKFRYADLAIARYEEAYNAQLEKSSDKLDDLEKTILSVHQYCFYALHVSSL